MLEPVAFPVHPGYEFRPVSVPVMALEETLAERLAAYRQHALVRDLDDRSDPAVTCLSWRSRLLVLGFPGEGSGGAQTLCQVVVLEGERESVSLRLKIHCRPAGDPVTKVGVGGREVRQGVVEHG